MKKHESVVSGARPLRFVLPAICICAMTVLASACAGPRGPGGHRLPPQPTLTAHSTYFHEAVLVQAKLSAMRLPLDRDGEGKSGRGRSGGPGGGMHRHGGGMGGPPSGDMGRGEGVPDANSSGQMAGSITAPPRMTLHISLTNQSAQPIDVYVTDVVSALGNFAVRPEHLQLAPGQQGELEPFNASFPENIEGLPVEVRIRRGTERESQILHLAAEKTPAPPSP